MMTSEEKRARFLEIAHEWIGVPWGSTGFRKERGVNCIGLIVGIARECGFLPRLDAEGTAYATFSKPPNPGDMAKKAVGMLTAIPVKDAIPGDLMLMRVGGQPQHITIVTNLNPLQVIHADTKAKKVRKSVPLPGWFPAGAFQIPEIEE